MSDKKNIKKGKVKRLKDLEIDEVSMVDKPAIGETFVVTKSVKDKGANVGNKTTVKKTASWKSAVKKDANSTHCVFCGITKAEEAEQMGMGLKNNVCFECACEHYEKGVFDACIDGTFDAVKFSESYPDIKLKLTLEKQDGEGSTEGDEQDGEESGSAESGEASSSESEGSSSEDEGAAGSDVSSSSGEGSEGGEAASSSDSEGASSQSSELGSVGEVGKRVVAVEKSLEDMKGMMESMMMLHDSAAYALNEVVGLTLACLDMTVKMMEEEADEPDEGEKSLFAEIRESMKAVKADISKRGAKISQSRLALLQEIATKLSSLIDSVGAESAKGGKKKKSLDEVQKSLQGVKDEVKASQDSLKKEFDEKFKSIDEKLGELEQSGGASMGLDDDEEDDSSEGEGSEEKSKSIFSGIIDVDSIKKRAEERNRRLKG